MYCKNCGEELKDDDKVCSKCGTNVQGKRDLSQKKTRLLPLRMKGRMFCLDFLQKTLVAL